MSDVVEDSSGRIFVATESGGVNLACGDSLTDPELAFRHFDTSTGLDSDVAVSLAESDGRIWIVGSNRLMTLDPTTGITGYFNTRFMGRTYRFAEARPARLGNGRLLVGHDAGALLIDENRMHRSRYSPRIALTRISLPGQEARRTVDHIERLSLAPDERNVTLQFAALDYSDPASVCYAFRLDDAEWTYMGRNRTVSLFGLDPGTCTLQVRSTNADGVWADNTRTLVIDVEARFHETAHGRLLMALAALCVAGLCVWLWLYVRRINRLRRETLDAYLAIVAKHGVDDRTPHAEPAVHLSEADEAFMARVMDYVEKHIDEPGAGVNEMAAAAATSRSGLNRKLKALVGLTPADFLREARIKHACNLLRQTGLTVTEVADRCGFADSKYFGKCFKASVGLSSTDYRHSHTD